MTKSPGKVGIYSPYLDTAGGGEKYILTIAEILSKDFEVEILIDQKLSKIGWNEIRDKNQSRHGLDLSHVSATNAPVGVGSSILNRLFFLKRYKYLFYNSDGSVFYSTAGKSIIHFQMPFNAPPGFKLWQSIKTSSWDKAIYNSIFTKDHVEKSWTIKGVVVYPPVDTTKIKPLAKKNQILTVGRFDGFTKVKKQKLMIEEFKKIIDSKELHGWSLHLAGGMLPGDKPYVEELKKEAKGYQIFFYENTPLEQLNRLYGESKIYWHAMGHKEEDPQRVEHFGISTVEAMAGGCVPVVINKGGQKEIVSNGENGFVWDSAEELTDRTVELSKDNQLLKSLSGKAIVDSKRFDKKVFAEKIISILK